MKIVFWKVEKFKDPVVPFKLCGARKLTPTREFKNIYIYIYQHKWRAYILNEQFLKGYYLRIRAWARKRTRGKAHKLNEQFLKRYCLRIRAWAPKRAQRWAHRLNKEFKVLSQDKSESSKESTTTSAQVEWIIPLEVLSQDKNASFKESRTTST